MADSPIYNLPPLPSLVGDERIPADKSPFGVAGSTGYTTPTALAAFLANATINGTLNPGFLPVASGPKALVDSRAFQDATSFKISNSTGKSYASVSDTEVRLLIDNSPISNYSSIYLNLSSILVQYVGSGGQSGSFGINNTLTSVFHNTAVSINSPSIYLPQVAVNGILGLDSGGKIINTGINTSDISGLIPTVTVFTAAWSTQTLANVPTLFYFVNASNSTAKTINLPLNPTNNNYVVIKDKKGDAATYNITIQGNGKSIDGVSAILINGNNQAYTLKYDGTSWNII